VIDTRDVFAALHRPAEISRVPDAGDQG